MGYIFYTKPEGMLTLRIPTDTPTLLRFTAFTSAKQGSLSVPLIFTRSQCLTLARVLTDAAHALERAEAIANRTNTVLKCGCGTHYNRMGWEALKLIGTQDDGDGGLLELRNCAKCGSTRAILLGKKEGTSNDEGKDIEGRGEERSPHGGRNPRDDG